MVTKDLKKHRRKKIRYRIRKKIHGTSACPRLSVYKSNKYVYVQLIDDKKGHTLVSMDTRKQQGKPVELAKKLGKGIVEAAKKKTITKIVYDRSGYRYQGIVKALFEAAQKELSNIHG